MQLTKEGRDSLKNNCRASQSLYGAHKQSEAPGVGNWVGYFQASLTTGILCVSGDGRPSVDGSQEAIRSTDNV